MDWSWEPCYTHFINTIAYIQSFLKGLFDWRRGFPLAFLLVFSLASGFLFDRFSVASAYRNGPDETAPMVFMGTPAPTPAPKEVPAPIIELSSLSGSWAASGASEEVEEATRD